jgi:MFS family permease
MSIKDYKKTAKLNVFYGYSLQFLNQLVFTLGLWYIFGSQFRGWNPLQIFILFGVGWQLSFLFEIPTGVLSDKFGRLKIFRIGQLIQGLAYIILGLSNNFYLLAFAMVINAMGSAAQSGTIDPVVGLSLDKAKLKDRIQHYQGNTFAVSRIARLIATLIAPFIYKFWPPLIFLAYAVVCLISILVSFGVHDYAAYSKDRASGFVNHFNKALSLIKTSRKLKFVILMSIITMNSELIWFIVQPIGESIDLSVAQISIVYSISVVVTAIFAKLSGKLYKGIRTLETIALLKILTSIVSVLLLLNFVNLFALIFTQILTSISVGLNTPAANSYLQHHVKEKYLSTIMSIYWATYSLSLILINIISGWILKNYSIHAQLIFILFFSILSLIPVLISIVKLKKPD